MRASFLLPALIAAAPAAAQVRPVPVQPASEVEALRGVEVFLINEGAAPVQDEGPRQIQVTAVDGTKLVLERVPGPAHSIAPGAFAKARYVPVGVTHPAPPPPPVQPITLAGQGETTLPSATGTSSGFFERFRPHEPIYGAFGTKDAGGKLQFSFAFQPFGGDGPASHLRFAYTQTMFWNIWAESGPFRATIYSPEIFVTMPYGDDLDFDIGYRHDSNGRGVDDGSLDANRIYGRVTKRFDLGHDWYLTVAPEAWLYVGAHSGRGDLARYWGYTSLTAAIGQENGLKIAVTGRGNIDSGRGAAEMFVSYPVARIIDGVGIYAFGQAFTGFSETLDEYRVNDTHARFGIAFTR